MRIDAPFFPKTDCKPGTESAVGGGGDAASRRRAIDGGGRRSFRPEDAAPALYLECCGIVRLPGKDERKGGDPSLSRELLCRGRLGGPARDAPPH